MKTWYKKAVSPHINSPFNHLISFILLTLSLSTLFCAHCHVALTSANICYHYFYIAFIFQFRNELALWFSANSNILEYSLSIFYVQIPCGSSKICLLNHSSSEKKTQTKKQIERYVSLWRSRRILQMPSSI